MFDIREEILQDLQNGVCSLVCIEDIDVSGKIELCKVNEDHVFILDEAKEAYKTIVEDSENLSIHSGVNQV